MPLHSQEPICRFNPTMEKAVQKESAMFITATCPCENEGQPRVTNVLSMEGCGQAPMAYHPKFADFTMQCVCHILHFASSLDYVS